MWYATCMKKQKPAPGWYVDYDEWNEKYLDSTIYQVTLEGKFLLANSGQEVEPPSGTLWPVRLVQR